MAFLRDHLWLIGFLVVGGLFWLLGISIAPFVVGALAAYLLNPVAAWLEDREWPRPLSALVLVAATFGVVLGALIVLIPLLLSDFRDFLAKVPELLAQAYERLWRLVGPYVEQFGLRADSLSGDMIGNAASAVSKTLTQAGTGLFVAVDAMLLVFLTPFVAYWMLRDWPHILERAVALVPPPSQPELRALGRKLDRRLGGWLRGQALICLFQAVWHSVGLFLIGLDSWLLVGIATGVANFIPVIGNWAMFFVALALAIIQFDSLMPVAAVVGLYAASQVLEDTVLYPKLVGDRIDLHPLWVIFALLVSATLFGLAGALLAMPLACIAQVIIGWLVERYRASSLYRRRG
jgi:predicted PurR-regulated permease PerM